MRSITRETLKVCVHPSNTLDDQSLFWREWRSREHLQGTRFNFDHCDAAEYGAVTAAAGSSQWNGTSLHGAMARRRNSADSARACCLDSYYYPVGQGIHPANSDPVTYHANWVVGKQAKIVKLIHSRTDNFGYNVSRVVDKMHNFSL